MKKFKVTKKTTFNVSMTLEAEDENDAVMKSEASNISHNFTDQGSPDDEYIVEEINPLKEATDFLVELHDIYAISSDLEIWPPIEKFLKSQDIAFRAW